MPLPTNWGTAGNMQFPASAMNTLDTAVNAVTPTVTSQALSGTTLVMTIASTPIQVFTGTTQNQVVTLPSTAGPDGQQWLLINAGTTATVTCNGSTSGTPVVIAAGAAALLIATSTTPTTAANWVVQNYLAPGGGVTGSTTPTNGDAAEWDSNLNLSANNFISTPVTTITTATTTTLTLASNAIQVFTTSLNTTQTYILPSTCPAGTTFLFICNGTNLNNIQVDASNTGSVGAINVGACAYATAIVANPTTPAGWVWNGPAYPAAENQFTAIQDFYATFKMHTTTLSTAAAGVVEYDGTAFYASPAASTRAVMDVEEFCTLTTAYTTPGGTTAAQKLFNTTTNGAVTLPIGTYFFECLFTLSAMSGTSGTFGFALGVGTAVIGGILWRGDAAKSTILTTSTPTTSINIIATNTTLGLTANTNTVGWATISGKVRIGTAGTVIPQFQTSVASASIVGVDSYFRIWTAGISTVTNTGNWS